ncbi:MAG TPA: amidohydrolase family protein [Acidimicrobiales bacterium]|nr:amidohydrolase family protein [Acidimicrobiales bacterium]
MPVGEIGAASKKLPEKAHSNEALVSVPRFSEMHPGDYDPKVRSQDMQSSGVVASVCFPSFPRFAGVRFLNFKDQELAESCVTAYNDFVIEEWCPGGPKGMFVPLIIPFLTDPAKTAAEIRRCAALGARSITMPENTVPLDLPSYYTDHWDPIWEACQETDMVVSLHLGTSGNRYMPSPDGSDMLPLVLVTGVGCQLSLINLLFSPVCHKFPQLKIVFSESGVGWVPYALERADLVWERYGRRDDAISENSEPPSEVFRRNMFVCQVEEMVGAKLIDDLGAETVLWELDYPHPDTVWPYTQQVAEEVFAASGLSQETIELVTHGNSEKLFRWEPATI